MNIENKDALEDISPHTTKSSASESPLPSRSGVYQKPEERSGLLASLTPETRLLGLIVLVIEGVLGGALVKFGDDITKFYIIISVMGGLIVIVALISLTQFWLSPPIRTFSEENIIIPVKREGKVGGEQEKTRFDYHVFIATAMAAIDDEKLRAKRVVDLDNISDSICGALKVVNPNVRVFNAAAKVRTTDEFEDSAIALTKNIERMRASKYLALLYFENLPTSALIEVGMALSLGKGSTWFVRQGTPVPFLMKGQPIAGPHLPIVRIVSFRDENDLIRLIKENASDYFPV